jgi:hypothetical protein
VCARAQAVVSAIRAKDRQLELDMAKLNAAAATADRLHVRALRGRGL